MKITLSGVLPECPRREQEGVPQGASINLSVGSGRAPAEGAVKASSGSIKGHSKSRLQARLDKVCGRSSQRVHEDSFSGGAQTRGRIKESYYVRDVYSVIAVGLLGA